MNTIPIPKFVKTNGEGYCALMRVYEKLCDIVDDQALLDFTECVEFDANLAAVLGSLFDDFIKKGKKLILLLPKDRKVKRGLSRIKFFQAFQTDSPSEDRENYMEYRCFSPSDSEVFKRYIHEQLINKNNFPAHSKMVGDHITESIFEIFCNAVQHGGCDAIYSCGERHDGDKTTLDITIVDRGRTIYKVVNDYFARRSGPHLNPVECIKWAIVEGNTTKNEPGGLGLALIIEFLTLNKGLMQIVSHNALVHFADGEMKGETLDCIFDGTIVNMKFNFDDNNHYYMRKEVDMTDLL